MEVQSKTVALDYIIAFHIAKTNNLTWTEEEYQSQYDSFIKELTDAGYTKEDATEYVNTKQLNYLKATMTYKIASEWFINQVFANK
jgi:virulence-associated protein VapD